MPVNLLNRLREFENWSLCTPFALLALMIIWQSLLAPEPVHDPAPAPRAALQTDPQLSISAALPEHTRLDSDGDGVLDTEDSCPGLMGTAQWLGCPRDTDRDGVYDLDDHCPDRAGTDALGCPIDSDSDGVVDSIDQCPEQHGSLTRGGCPADSDNDGINDLSDACPDKPGQLATAGCPIDTDQDGIVDLQDDCPQFAGPESNDGCPADADGDGVEDRIDLCPIQPGSAENRGCDDADPDADGIAGNADECPQSAGIAANHGCPADSDADGVHDGEDLCPATVGSENFRGCPLSETSETTADGSSGELAADTDAGVDYKAIPVSSEDQRVISEAMAQIEFKPWSAELTGNSDQAIQQVAELLGRYQEALIAVEGHTDSSGSAEGNMRLSIERARACALQLMAAGVDSQRIEAAGFGESQPIASNATAEGRSRNRRVEFHLRFAE